MLLEDDEVFFISVKHPQESISAEYEDFLATNEDFKRYCSEVFSLEPDNPTESMALKRYIRAKKSVKVIKQTYTEDKAEKGFRRTITTKKGNVKIAYTEVKENRIYVQVGNLYLRGYRVFLADLCLDSSTGFIPLNNADNVGNIEILQYSKRSCRKGVKYIKNKLQNILYIVDRVFMTERQMQNDIENPKEVDLSKFVKKLL